MNHLLLLVYISNLNSDNFCRLCGSFLDRCSRQVAMNTVCWSYSQCSGALCNHTNFLSSLKDIILDTPNNNSATSKFVVTFGLLLRPLRQILYAAHSTAWEPLI